MYVVKVKCKIIDYNNIEFVSFTFVVFLNFNIIVKACISLVAASSQFRSFQTI